MSLLRRCGADTKGAPAGVADTLLFAFRHFPLAEVYLMRRMQQMQRRRRRAREVLANA